MGKEVVRMIRKPRARINNSDKKRSKRNKTISDNNNDKLFLRGRQVKRPASSATGDNCTQLGDLTTVLFWELGRLAR